MEKNDRMDMSLRFNGFGSLFELMHNFDLYREAFPEFHDEWLEKMVEAYEANKKLSERQLEIVVSIAKHIGLKPGWNDSEAF